MNGQLPKGWEWAAIEDLCLFNPKHPPDVDRNSQVSFVPMSVISEATGTIRPHDTRILDNVWRGYTHFANNDVIFAKITPCMENGKSAVARGLTNGMACGSTEFYVLRCLGGTAPDYVHQYLRQKWFLQEAERHMIGAVGQRRVPKKFLAKTLLPIPPRNEQHRIVGKVETLMERSRRAKVALDAIPALLDQYRQSVLAAAFRGELTKGWREENQGVKPASNFIECIHTERRKIWEQAELVKIRARGKEPKGNNWKTKYKDPTSPTIVETSSLPTTWEIASLDTLITVIEAGKNFKCIERPPSANEVGLVKISAVTWGEFNPLESKTVPESLVLNNKTKIQEGDFLISRANTRELVGACVIAGNFDGELHLSDKVLRLRFASKIEPYVMWFLRSPEGRRQIERHARGNQHSMKNISQDHLKRIAIPIPPERELQEITNQITKHAASISVIKQMMGNELPRLTALNQSILAKAFRGELVPQDPMDEPASALLERILVERKTNGKATRATNEMRSRKMVQQKRTRKIISIVDALKEATIPLSAQDLLMRAGYPNDVATDQLELFFLEVREQLNEGTITCHREGNEDIFVLAG